MATSTGAYDVWLTEKLTSLSPEFDTDVFVSYIISILDTDSPDEEITESIEEILSQVLVTLSLFLSLSLCFVLPTVSTAVQISK